jgi:nitrate/TMAO reductase-like tetraheme cytochrome c subunit
MSQLTGSLRALHSFICLLVLCGAVHAADNLWTPAQDNAAWRAECGACHMAFPPAMLSSGEWSKIMSELPSHFGADASLDAPVQQEIARYLELHGASSSQNDSSMSLPRITTTDRFIAKHRSAIRLWKRGRVKSLTDCMACHNSQR